MPKGMNLNVSKSYYSKIISKKALKNQTNKNPSKFVSGKNYMVVLIIISVGKGCQNHYYFPKIINIIHR